MNKSKFEKLSKEFPFINETVLENDQGGRRFKIEYLDNISVSIANVVLLGFTPTEYMTGTREDPDRIHQWQQVHLVMKDLTVIRDAVMHKRQLSSGLTILEAIDHEKYWFDLRYIVVTEGGYCTINYRSMPNFRATIYKFRNNDFCCKLIDEAKKFARDWEASYFHDPYGFSM